MANEKRLIDGDKLRGLKYEKVKFSDYKEGWNDAIDTILTEVFSPSVDAVEVVHARWKYYHKQNKAVCTNCSFERDLDANFGKAVSCPHCGAKMDGDGNGTL